jgi:hypothetical protein
MVPTQLKPENFAAYPLEARQIATSKIRLLQQLPIAFLPLLLRELIGYDWRFPAERRELDNQLAYLESLPSEQRNKAMAPFVALRLSPELEGMDWVGAPTQFSEQLSAQLWATHQIDAFRKAAIAYVQEVNAAAPKEPLPASRLGIVVIGQGVGVNRYPLFRKLRGEGVYFNNVNPEGGWRILLNSVVARASAHPVPFGHWYIDGAANASVPRTGLTCISFDSLESVRSALLAKMRKVMQRGGGGPEMLRTMLAQMRPEDLGLSAAADEAVQNRFQISVLTEGSGTQLFSTTFVQWSAREALRRAQPLTLLARFAPRQRDQSLKELLSGARPRVPDPDGSLIDADMGAYYTWINQQRLSGAAQSGFLVWFENHSEAVAIAPSLQRGTEEHGAIDMRQLLARIS